MASPMTNMMTIDLEEWFQVYNLSEAIPAQQWDRQDMRAEASTDLILTLLDKHRTKATFFVLGWLAERRPALIRRLAREGHEIACHGYSHRLLTKLTPDELDAELARALPTLRELSGQPVTGFRAPSFSVTRETLWAYPILAKHGVTWDSSVFPIGMHPDYGIGDAPLTPYRATDGVVELPMSCAEVLGRRIPCSGGGYFRIFPYAVTQRLMRRCNAQGRPVMFYLHPWEFDPGQPRVPLSRSKAFRHYTNLDRTTARFDRLLGDFPFATIQQVMSPQLRALRQE